MEEMRVSQKISILALEIYIQPIIILWRKVSCLGFVIYFYLEVTVVVGGHRAAEVFGIVMEVLGRVDNAYRNVSGRGFVGKQHFHIQYFLIIVIPYLIIINNNIRRGEAMIQCTR